VLYVFASIAFVTNLLTYSLTGGGNLLSLAWISRRRKNRAALTGRTIGLTRLASVASERRRKTLTETSGCGHIGESDGRIQMRDGLATPGEDVLDGNHRVSAEAGRGVERRCRRTRESIIETTATWRKPI